MKPDIIRQSTKADLKAIHQWLVEEKAQGVAGNFLCNWELIKKSQQNGRLTVYIHGQSGSPIAFQLGGLLNPGILQVRNDWRRKGIGKKLVEHCIRKAKENDECFLVIECKPSSSIPFWKAMGFTLLKNTTDRKLAYQVVEKKFRLRGNGKPIRVRVRFFPESRKYGGAKRAPLQYMGSKGRSRDGPRYLPE